MRKIKIVSLLLVVCMLLSLSSAVAGEKTTIRFLQLWADELTQAILKQVIDEYEALYPDVKVEMETSTFDNINQQLSINVASGTAPDIVFLNNPDVASFAKMGALADITEYLTQWDEFDQFYPGVVEAAVVDGKVYGLPYDTNCLALFYNKDMLDSKGITPPTTMEELAAAATALTQPDKGVYGFGVAGLDSEETTFQFIPTLYSFGGTFDKINSDAAKAALQMYADMIANGAMSPEVISINQTDLRDRFLAGQFAMMYSGTWNIAPMKQGKYPVNFNWGVSLIPAGPAGSYSVIGGKIICCGQGGHVEEAVNFMKLLCNKQHILDFAKQVGAVPNRYDVAKDEYWQKDPEIAVFVKQMETAVPRGPHYNWPKISQAIRTAIGAVLSGNKGVSDALDEAQLTIDTLLN